jgi:hypothetical protein
MFASISKCLDLLKKLLFVAGLFFYSLHGIAKDLKGTINPNKLSVFADFLYWHASEETSSSWAYMPQLPNITAPNIYFNWSPGARTGLDYLFDNGLSTKFYWTHFSSTAQKNTQADNGKIVFPEFFNGFTTLTPFTSGHISWQVNMNMFDFEIGHPFQWKNSFMTRPFLGVKGGTINQNINSNWNYQGEVFGIFPITYAATENLFNNFSGVGPSFGLDNKWNIFKNLNLRGDISGAWLWGNWKIQDVYQGPSLSGLQLETTISNNISSALGAYMLRYFAGLDWTYESQVSYAIKIGYEMQFWMNQLRIPVFQQVPVHGDLTLQGVTCGLLIKF